MPSASNEIVINRSVSEVFEFLSNPESDPMWRHGIGVSSTPRPNTQRHPQLMVCLNTGDEKYFVADENLQVDCLVHIAPQRLQMWQCNSLKGSLGIYSPGQSQRGRTSFITARALLLAKVAVIAQSAKKPMGGGIGDPKLVGDVNHSKRDALAQKVKDLESIGH